MDLMGFRVPFATDYDTRIENENEFMGFNLRAAVSLLRRENSGAGPPCWRGSKYPFHHRAGERSRSDRGGGVQICEDGFCVGCDRIQKGTIRLDGIRGVAGKSR